MLIVFELDGFLAVDVGKQDPLNIGAIKPGIEELLTQTISRLAIKHRVNHELQIGVITDRADWPLQGTAPPTEFKFANLGAEKQQRQISKAVGHWLYTQGLPMFYRVYDFDTKFAEDGLTLAVLRDEIIPRKVPPQHSKFIDEVIVLALPFLEIITGDTDEEANYSNSPCINTVTIRELSDANGQPEPHSDRPEPGRGSSVDGGGSGDPTLPV